MLAFRQLFWLLEWLYEIEKGALFVCNAHMKSNLGPVEMTLTGNVNGSQMLCWIIIGSIFRFIYYLRILIFFKKLIKMF